jgi:CHAT domain-containing protein
VFTFVPVHAAGIYESRHQECISDYAVSSYTPTLAALLRAQRHTPILSAETPRLLVIAAEKAQDATLSMLPMVREEIAAVIESVRKVGISLEKEDKSVSATISEVSTQLEAAHFVHIACHGIQDPDTPLKSHFCLCDGDVSVQDLMNLDLKDACFAFLSACETAKGDRKQPDQTIHLAAAMLFIGFKSVVATLWYV